MLHQLEHPALDFLLAINFQNFVYEEGCAVWFSESIYRVQKPVTFEPQKRQKYTRLEDPNVHVVLQCALHQKTS